MAQLTMTVTATVYGRLLAYWLMWAMAWLQFPERACLRAGLCVTFTRLKLGGRHVRWIWLGRYRHGPA